MAKTNSDSVKKICKREECGKEFTNKELWRVYGEWADTRYCSAYCATDLNFEKKEEKKAVPKKRKHTGKHTEGPFEVRVGKEYCFHDTTRVAVVKVIEDKEAIDEEDRFTEETVAEIWPAGNDQDIADGYLFAAASELFEIVQTVVNNSKTGKTHALDIEYFESVLNKAEGKS